MIFVCVKVMINPVVGCLELEEEKFQNLLFIFVEN